MQHLIEASSAEPKIVSTKARKSREHAGKLLHRLAILPDALRSDRKNKANIFLKLERCAHVMTFAHLTGPLIGIATLLGPKRTALVVLTTPRDG